MTDNLSFPELIADYLSDLDPVLANDNIPLQKRPLEAALLFARQYECILEDGVTEERWTPEEDLSNAVTKRWFRMLYREIEGWYQSRYGDAFANPANKIIKGLVLIWGTPFALAVPCYIIQPDQPGQTLLLRFPDSVAEGEDPASWLIAPPNLSHMTAKELTKVRADCSKIASLLRSIRVKLIGIPKREPITNGFLSQIESYIESAAEYALTGQESSISRAYWEVQMACECAYKALLMYKNGTFKEIHDLFILHDEATLIGMNLDRNLLKNIPRRKEMIGVRYGQTESRTIAEFYKAYFVMLRIVEAALKPMVKLELGKASLTFIKPPWFS